MRMKYKVWDKENKKWYEPIYEAYAGRLEDLKLTPSGELCMRTFAEGTRNEETIHESMFPNRFTVVWFTGLKDKNEKEIYEGDIIRFTYWWFDGSERDSILEGVIEYDAAAMSFQLKQINNEFFENHTGYEKGEGALCFGELRFAEDDFEVIGNIYEHENLLTDGK